MKCFECGEKILSKSEESFIGLDVPHITLILHDGCYRPIKGDLNKYVHDNVEKIEAWIDYMSSQKVDKKGKRKYNVPKNNDIVELEEIEDLEEDNEDDEDNEE
jgi:hypothetical protein